jgi:hypothetical protein
MSKLASGLFAMAALNTTLLIFLLLFWQRIPDALDLLIMLWVWPLAIGKLMLERKS